MLNVIRKLTVAGLLFASLVLLVSQFEMGALNHPTAFDTQSIFLHMADVVGVSAAIPANPYNTLAQQLEQKQAALNAQEVELQQRQALGMQTQSGGAGGSADVAGNSTGSRNLVVIVVFALVVDAFLLVLNLYIVRKTKLSGIKQDDYSQTAGLGAA